MAKWRSPFKASSRQTTAFKKKGSWAAGYHTGVDRVCDSNTALVSPTSATVITNAYDNSYGNYVVLKTADNKVILMAHMQSKSTLKVGAKINAGDFIGYMGSTGNSTGPHLHIEVENSTSWAYNKNLLDPDDYINWNSFSNSSSNNKYVSAVKWKNGSTKETVYTQSNLADKIGTINVKESADCYGKKGSGYIVVYDLDGTSKHKAGFVKYDGGVSSVKSGGKTYENGSTKETVYADTKKADVIGSLDPYETCTCFAKIDGMYLVLYKINSTSNYKVGFVSYSGGVN